MSSQYSIDLEHFDVDAFEKDLRELDRQCFDEEHEKKREETNKLIELIYDLSNPIDYWLKKAIDLYQLDIERCQECFNDFCASYVENKVYSLQVVCNAIATCNEFDFLVRFRCLDALNKNSVTLSVLQDYMIHPTDDINFTMYVDFLIKCLVDKKTKHSDCQNLVTFVFQNGHIVWNVKYGLWKTVVSCIHLPDSVIKSCGKVLVCNNPLCNYTVLSCQLSRLDDSVYLQLLKRTELHTDDKVKADMYDHLLQYPCTTKEANRLLKELGGGMKTLDSSQNVHMVTADIDKWLIQLWKVQVGQTRPEDVCRDIVELWGESGEIVHSIQRIQLDNGVYGKVNMRLLGILTRVWCKIQTHEFKETCMERLKEELIEMAETCSTGHLLRLMNVFSGMEDSGLSIDPSIELRSVITKRVEMYMDTLKGQFPIEVEKVVVPQTLIVRQRILHGGEEERIDDFDRDSVIRGWSTQDSSDSSNLSSDLSSDSLSFIEEEPISDLSTTLQDMKVEHEEHIKPSIVQLTEDPQDLYDMVMDAWMYGNEDVLQKYLYKQLASIHDECEKDYIGQNLMSKDQFEECFRDVTTNLFTS